MNKKMKSIIVAMILVLIVTTTTVACYHDSDTKPSTHQGSAGYAIIHFECESPEGFPEDRYIGILNNVNATLCGQTKFIVTNIPWVIFGTLLETQDPIHVTMEFYGGLVDPTGQPTTISGFAKNIVWEW